MKGFGYLAKEGLKNVWSNRIMSIASVCVLISCLVLTGAAALFSVNVSSIVDDVGKANETKVLIDRDVPQLDAVYIGKDIEKLPNVETTRFITSEEGLKQYKKWLGDELFDRVNEKEKVLNDTIVVVMKDLSKYDDTVNTILKMDGVEAINSQQELAKKLTDISNMVNFMCLGVVGALMIISLFIIANTIRATMYSRRYEISIMKSVGATNSFVRMPFLVEGMIIGLISATISTGCIALLYDVVFSLIQSNFSSISIVFIPMGNVILYVAGAFVVAGVLVGIFGSLISIRKYLKMEGNEILGW